MTPRLLTGAARELMPNDRVHTAVVDLVDAGAVEAAAAATIEAFGGIDILVANAGIAGRSDTLWQYPVDEWKQVIDVNLNGVFHCCRAVVPAMIEQNYGRIVTVASIAGKEGNPKAAAYSASKAGVIALTKSLGKELAGFDISVNCITPAAAKTAILEQLHAGAHRVHALEDPAQPLPAGRRSGGHGRVAGVGRELLHHRRGVRSERRPRDLLVPALESRHGNPIRLRARHLR